MHVHDQGNAPYQLKPIVSHSRLNKFLSSSGRDSLKADNEKGIELRRCTVEALSEDGPEDFEALLVPVVVDEDSATLAFFVVFGAPNMSTRVRCLFSPTDAVGSSGASSLGWAVGSWDALVSADASGWEELASTFSMRLRVLLSIDFDAMFLAGSGCLIPE
jgi:hypothetical protein